MAACPPTALTPHQPSPDTTRKKKASASLTGTQTSGALERGCASRIPVTSELWSSGQQVGNELMMNTRIDPFLPVAFPSLILVQALITSHTPALYSHPLSCLQLFLSPYFFFHIVVRILFLKHHFHHTPPPAASNCIKSKLQVPSHCLDHYLLYSWTPLQPSKRPDTVYTMLQHTVNSVNSVRSSVNHLDVLSTRRQTSGLTEEIYCVDGGFFFLNSVDQMFWHNVDTSLSPTFVLMACLYNFLFTWNRTCLLDAMFSLPSKLWSEFPPPQSSSRLIPLNHNLGSF